MKNKMSDVRNHLVSMMEELGEPADTARPDTVERAKALSLVAGQYIAAVKVEIDAACLAKKAGYVPACTQGSLLQIGADGRTIAGQVTPAPN